MIEAAWQSLAMGDGQIEFELVGTAPRWIGPCGVLDLGTVGAEIEFAFPCRLDARGAVEKARQLGERDRLPVVEVADRMTFMQQCCDRRMGMRRRGRELAEIDGLALPPRPHRRRPRYRARMRIKSTQRVGLSAFGAVGVEQQIVKVPENQVVVAFGRPQAVAAGGIDLEEDLAIHQQSEKLDPGKAALSPQPADF